VGSGEKLARAERVAKALGALFVSTRVPVIVVRATGEFIAANDAAIAKYGYSLEELLERRIHDLQATPRSIEQDLERAHRGDPSQLDRRAHRRKDGTVLWVVPTAGPIEIDGEALIVSVLTDVTATVSVEERARLDGERAEVMWQAAIERLGSGFALLDAQHRVVRANKAMCALLGREVRDVVGKRCRDLFPLCQRETGPCRHEIALAERTRVVREFVSPRTGKPLRVEILPALANEAGITTIHVTHDLTDERAIRSRLVTADRLATIGRLAAGVAHEVNNPAGFVTLALQLIKDQIALGKLPTEETTNIIDEAVAAMLQINQIMRDLTGFTRDRARQVTDLGAVVNSAIRIAAHETRDRARVERVLGDDVIADVRGARVAQVVLNLIVNAAQAIAPGNIDRNRIVVRAYRDGDRACIDVSDTGPGVPREILDRIFEPFFTTREATGGSGLGLWLSKTIIEEEGGTLAHRDVPNGGACFTISLPAMPIDVAETSSSAPALT
jgi:PAS domain S-box-containing protein